MELVIPDVSNRESRIVLFTDEEKEKILDPRLRMSGITEGTHFHPLRCKPQVCMRDSCMTRELRRSFSRTRTEGQRSIR